VKLEKKKTISKKWKRKSTIFLKMSIDYNTYGHSGSFAEFKEQELKRTMKET
jgi:hypothetical protein